MNKVIRIAILTNIIPTYRKGFYDLLFENKDLSVTVYCQSHIPGMNLKSIHDLYGKNVRLVKMISARGEKFAWQFLPWIEIYKNYDVIFLQGNPRYLSDVFYGIFLKIFRKKIVLWTMAHSYGANPLNERLRLLWSRIFRHIFVYTDAEVDYLRDRGFNNNYILGMNNGLNQKSIDQSIQNWSEQKLKEWCIDKKLTDKIILLSCARLEKKNKFDLFVKVLPRVVNYFPEVIWCIIGDGIEKVNLETQIAQAGLEKYVLFVGELYDEEKLAPWFLTAKLFIHPASIGLGLMHAFGYGLPVITSSNKLMHGPEFGAFIDNETGRVYSENNISDFVNTINDLLLNGSTRVKMKETVIEIARKKFNVDIMVERFVRIANAAYVNSKFIK